MSFLRKQSAPATGAGAQTSGHLYIQPSLMSTMPASAFVLPINLIETRMTDVAAQVASKLKEQAQAYTHACGMFIGDADDLVFSFDGFAIVNGGGFACNPSGATAIPASQMRNKLSTFDVTASGTTLCVAHRADVRRAIEGFKV